MSSRASTSRAGWPRPAETLFLQTGEQLAHRLRGAHRVAARRAGVAFRTCREQPEDSVLACWSSLPCTATWTGPVFSPRGRPRRCCLGRRPARCSDPQLYPRRRALRRPAGDVLTVIVRTSPAGAGGVRGERFGEVALEVEPTTATTSSGGRDASGSTLMTYRAITMPATWGGGQRAAQLREVGPEPGRERREDLPGHLALHATLSFRGTSTGPAATRSAGRRISPGVRPGGDALLRPDPLLHRDNEPDLDFGDGPRVKASSTGVVRTQQAC